jgi:hypothetical protein
MAGAVAGWRGDGTRRQPRHTRGRARRRADDRAMSTAWRDGEKFYDTVVLLSVAVFFLLAIGVGIIALQLR